MVEISGVDVRLKVSLKDGSEHRFSRPEHRKAPAKGTKSNRLRISAPTVHDPGGRRAAKYGAPEDSRFHPELAVHQLAESFLQTESREDRLELQAAIASQSRYGRESLSSSTISEEELGTGAAEGYTLPSFIASYLVGIADRLQLHVDNVTVYVELEHLHEGSNYQQVRASHTTRFLLKLSELCIQGVDAIPKDHNRGTVRRKVFLHHFSVLVLPEVPGDQSDPGSSEAMSPILKHQQASPLSSTLVLNAAQGACALSRHSGLTDRMTDSATDALTLGKMEPSMTLSEIPRPDTASAALPLPIGQDSSAKYSGFLAATSDDLALCSISDRASSYPVHLSSISDGIIMKDSGNVDGARSSPDGPVTTSRGRFNPSDGDNQEHAGPLATSGQPVTDTDDDLRAGQPVEDLTQSRIFTHDEAESMYMSALSGIKASTEEAMLMPGTWNWSEERADAQTQPECSDLAQSENDPISNSRDACAFDTITSSASQCPEIKKDPLEKDGPTDVLASLAQMSQTARQLLFIDRVSAWLPVTHVSDLPATPILQLGATFEADSCASGTKIRVDKDASLSENLRDSGLHAGETRGSIEVEILNVHSQFDMQIGRTLIAVANSTLWKSEEATKGIKGSDPSAPVSNLCLKISNMEIAFLEHVPEQSTVAAATKHSSHDDVLLLSISLAGLVCRTSVLNRDVQQQFLLKKISLSHSKGQFLSFNHDSRMRIPLRDTSALQKNDVEVFVVSSGGTSKLEIQSKPIRLTLELGQIDDVLSRSGGLSSLLELGSSIASSSIIRTSPRKTNEPRAEARGVRFEDSRIEPSLYDDLSLGLGKMNVRMGGVHVDVVGSECTIKATTSAVKIVHRAEGLGIQIDRISLLGPFLPESSEVPELSVDFHNTRLEYLPIPTDKDLDRLLAILTPSKDKYDADDDIMVDTLIRQRRKGGVVRLTVTSLTASLQGIACMAHLANISTELGKLSTVAKYLPVDDRPGVLSLWLVKDLNFDVNIGDPIGSLQLKVQALEGAHVSIPSLLAAQIGTASIRQVDGEVLLDEAVNYSNTSAVPPMIMCRFVADEMDPTIKLKLFNLCVEYHAKLCAAFLKTADSFSIGGSEDGSDNSSQSLVHASSPRSSESAADFVRRTNISVTIRDSALALNPRDNSGRALFVLTDSVVSSPLRDSKNIKVSTEIKKASVMVIDKANVYGSSSGSGHCISGLQSEGQAGALSHMDYVSIGYISSATSSVDIAQLDDEGNKSVEVEFGNALLILESCADSTQTLINIVNGLSPPAPPTKLSPYRTEIVPIEDLLASFTGDAFITEPGPEAGLRAKGRTNSYSILPEQQDIEYVSEFYQPDPDDPDDISESGIQSEMLDSEIAESIVSVSVAPVSIRQSVTQAAPTEAISNSLLDFRDDHFEREPAVGDTAHRWDSTKNVVGPASERNLRKSPLKVRVRGVHVIWNLFDGYDWQATRDVISEAVKDIETRAAAARRPRSASKSSPSAEDEDESVIGDFLFNSIYIGVPANKDPHELTSEINRDIDDLTSETGSYATSTTVTGLPARHQPSRPRRKKLKLKRSKQHKMTFELQGISADVLVFPPGSGEVQSSINIRVKDLEIFDHVPTSTWKKFATYMRDAGEREADTTMMHIEVLSVKPVPDLAASEMILKVTVLPLRLHVDQDALDFMSRFFEFKDQSAPVQSTTSSPLFLQRVEVNPVKIKLDFKAKRVDYGGLRSGRTTEFMNFFVLDQADIILRRVILYGVSGFDRLGIMLNNIWTPDVKRNQLPGILAGLAPIRPLVNVGSGVRDLVVVPMREYKKDGRIVRSIQKGALAFAKTTSKELIGLGAKLAIGTQTVLQNAEAMLAPTSPGENPHAWEDLDGNDESQKQISLYADQPIGVVQGLRGAYASLERDLLLAKDAIIAVPGEAMASGSAAGAAKAILKQAPTVILRPAIGASKAVGQTLLGAGNTLDRENWRRMEEVCHCLSFLCICLLPFTNQWDRSIKGTRV